MPVRVDIHFGAAHRILNQHGAKLMSEALDDAHFLAVGIASQGEYTTGKLAASLKTRGPIVTGDRITGSLYTELDYARAVHDGAKIHEIWPKTGSHVYRFDSRARPQLRFFWRRKGRVVYFPHIPGSPTTVGHSHPGIRTGKRFLTIPLEVVGRRYGLIVRTRDI